MQRLTKTQVISLLLASASAQTTFLSVLNGPSSADTATADQTLTKASTGTACDGGNAGCTTDGEKCAKVQIKGKDSTNVCIVEEFCGAMGKLDGATFIASCWATPAAGETATQPDDVDTDVYLSELEEFITKETVKWDSEEQLLVSPKFAYQDGWYTLVDGKWKETDKAADNRCFIDPQCEGGVKCCALYPDQNNRRCIARDLDKKVQRAGPTSFTPNCISISAEDAVPENAQDDIAKGALTEAQEELTKFENSLLADAKTAAKFDEMDADAQAAWTKEYDAEKAKADAFADELKVIAGYADDTCDDTCKAVVEAKLLDQAKAVYEACKLGADSIDCKDANDLAKAEWGARGKEYFTGDAAAREAKDAAVADAKNAEKSKIVAKAIGEAKDGEEGGKCGPTGTEEEDLDDIECKLETHCCGTATPAAGSLVTEAIKNVCGDKTALKYTKAETEFTLVCNPDAAMRLASAAAAVAALFYLE